MSWDVWAATANPANHSPKITRTIRPSRSCRVSAKYSEPEIYWIVKHGIRMTAMSAYGPFYNEDQLWSLAAFIHRIDKLTPAEIALILPPKH